MPRLPADAVRQGLLHPDADVRVCTQLLAGEEDPDLRNWLAQSLVEQFSTEGNEVARREVLDDPDLWELRDKLVVACTLTGQEFPELDGWRAAARDEKQRKPFAFGGPATPPVTRPPAVPRPAPIHRAEGRAGRNDPCPCGSGKKYKKCSLAKDEQSGR